MIKAQRVNGNTSYDLLKWNRRYLPYVVSWGFVHKDGSVRLEFWTFNHPSCKFSHFFIIQNYAVKRMLVISLNSCKGLNENRIHCSSGKFESQPKAYKKGASILDVGIFEERGWGRVKMYQIYCRHGGEDY